MFTPLRLTFVALLLVAILAPQAASSNPVANSVVRSSSFPLFFFQDRENTRNDFTVEPPATTTVETISRTGGGDVIFGWRNKRKEGDKPLPVPAKPEGKPVTFTIEDKKDIVVELFCSPIEGIVYDAPKGTEEFYGAKEGDKVNFWGATMALIVENCPNVKFVQLIVGDVVEVELKNGTKMKATLNVPMAVDDPEGKSRDPVGPKDGTPGVVAITDNIAMSWDTPGTQNLSNANTTGSFWGPIGKQIAFEWSNVARFREETKFCTFIFCDCKDHPGAFVGLVEWSYEIDVKLGDTADKSKGTAKTKCKFFTATEAKKGGAKDCMKVLEDYQKARAANMGPPFFDGVPAS
jgi:hypothetical protein